MNKAKLINTDGSYLCVELPSKWDELNLRELLYIGHNWQAWNDAQSKGEDMSGARVHLFMNLIRASGKQIVQFVKLIDGVADEEKLNLVRMVDFVWKDCTITNQLLPVVKSYFKKLYGPQDKMQNLTFGEFIFTERYFENYFKHRRDIDLLKLVAVLYRPLNAKGKRKAFDDDFDTEANIALVAELFSYAQLQAVFLFYLGCHKRLEKQYPLVFSGNNTGKKLPKELNFGLMNVAFAISDLGGLGTTKEVMQSNMHLILQRWQILMGNKEEAA